MNIRAKLTLILVALSLGVVSAAAIFSTVTLDTYFRERLLEELKIQAQEIEYVVATLPAFDSTGYERIQQLAHSANLRLTLIAGDGSVLFESDRPQSQLMEIENHLQREEVQEALRQGYGTARRRSATVAIEMLYLAKKATLKLPPAPGGALPGIIRVGIPLTRENTLMADIRSTVVTASLIVLVLVIAVSILVAGKLSSPIKEMARIAAEIRAGNFGQRLPVRSRDEIGKLAETLNSLIGRLNEDIAQFRKLERVRSEFLGNVSHELRTPIFAIQGMLETLLGGALDDTEVRRDFVERSLQNTQRLNSLLGDLIEISRIESGDMKMSFRFFPLQGMLETIAAELGPIAAQKNVLLSVSEADAQTEVLGDKERLKQAVTNLVDNAIKYTPPGGRVTLAWAREEDRVRVRVSDTGTGIAPEHLLRIFERFYRVDKERSREAGGTGLGLAIVKHIIEAHGSTVHVQSEPGAGSTFSFLLKA
jgi:two-component system phosphate regulon sensor histidine kinase PhoR